MPDPIRTQRTVAHETMVTRTLVRALKAVFTSEYHEGQFADLKVTPDFPQKKVDHPALQIEYNSEKIINAGVGHTEFFRDDEDVWRHWLHRRFEGSVSFTVLTLSPLDRDIMADAIMEVLSFGKLDELSEEFFDVIYGENDPSDPESNGAIPERAPVEAFLSQLYIDTDTLHSDGKSTEPVPWEGEDALVYSMSYSVRVGGGFYNRVPEYAFGGFVTGVDIDANDEATLFDADDNGTWLPTRSFADYGVVNMSVSERYAFQDAAVMRMRMRPLGTQVYERQDAGRIRMTLSLSGVDTRTRDSAATVQLTLAPSGTDWKENPDAAVMSMTATITTDDSRTYPDDNGVVAMLARIESIHYDEDTITGNFSTAVGLVQANYGSFGDEAVASLTVNPSGEEERERVDDGLIALTFDISGPDEYEMDADAIIDFATVELTGTISGVEETTNGRTCEITLVAITTGDHLAPSWQHIEDTYGSWTELIATFADWDAVVDGD